MLVTEKEGRLRIIRAGVLDPRPIPGVPVVRVQGRSGLLDVLLHPQFATNRFIYVSYLKPAGAERQAVLTVARGRFDGYLYVLRSWRCAETGQTPIRHTTRPARRWSRRQRMRPR